MKKAPLDKLGAPLVCVAHSLATPPIWVWVAVPVDFNLHRLHALPNREHSNLVLATPFGAARESALVSPPDYHPVWRHDDLGRLAGPHCHQEGGVDGAVRRSNSRGEGAASTSQERLPARLRPRIRLPVEGVRLGVEVTGVCLVTRLGPDVIPQTLSPLPVERSHDLVLADGRRPLPVTEGSDTVSLELPTTTWTTVSALAPRNDWQGDFSW